MQKTVKSIVIIYTLDFNQYSFVSTLCIDVQFESYRCNFPIQLFFGLDFCINHVYSRNVFDKSTKNLGVGKDFFEVDFIIKVRELHEIDGFIQR